MRERKQKQKINKCGNTYSKFLTSYGLNAIMGITNTAFIITIA